MRLAGGELGAQVGGEPVLDLLERRSRTGRTPWSWRLPARSVHPRRDPGPSAKCRSSDWCISSWSPLACGCVRRDRRLPDAESAGGGDAVVAEERRRPGRRPGSGPRRTTRRSASGSTGVRGGVPDGGGGEDDAGVGAGRGPRHDLVGQRCAGEPFTDDEDLGFDDDAVVVGDQFQVVLVDRPGLVDLVAAGQRIGRFDAALRRGVVAGTGPDRLR